MKMKRKPISPQRICFTTLNYIFFLAFMLLCIYPLWYVLIYTLSDPGQIASRNIVLLPRGFTLFNFRKVMELEGVFPAFVMSVLRTVCGTTLTVLCSTVMGYLFSKQDMPFRTFLYRFLVITMYISGGMIPTYLVFRSYGILNTFCVYILPSLVSAYYIILVKTYIEQLPAEMEESARLDGATVPQIIFWLIIPLSLPIIATIAIYAAVGQWNSWFDNHIYAFRNTNLMTLQYMLYNFMQEAEELAKLMSESSETIDQSQFITPMGIKMTVTLITILPIMLAYPFLQRFFIKGLMIGAVKG